MDTHHGNQLCNDTDYTDGAVQQEYGAYIQANLHYLDKRYWKAAQDLRSTKPLFEQIGEDLSSTLEEIREIAFIALYYALPVLGGHLMDSLDEHETHREGWRQEKGKDQRFVNEGMDTLTKLYTKFVKNGEYKPKPGKSKDPRPYVHRTITNWTDNQRRKDKRLTYLGDEDWNILIESPPDYLLGKLSAESAEDEALRNTSENTFMDTVPDYLTEREHQLYYAIIIEGWETEELAQQLGVSPGAIRQALSEGRRKMILRRDICAANKIIPWCYSPTRGGTIDFTDHPDWLVQEIEEAMKLALKASASVDDSGPVFLPLTSGRGRRPGRLYISNGTQKDIRLRLHNYLLAYGLDPEQYFMITQEFERCRPGSYKLSGFPILDKIINHVQGHGSTSSYDHTLKLGILNLITNAKERPFLPLRGDIPLHCDYPRGLFSPASLRGRLIITPWYKRSAYSRGLIRGCCYNPLMFRLISRQAPCRLGSCDFHKM